MRTGGDPLAPHTLSPQELKQLLASERAGRAFVAYRDGQSRLGLFGLPTQAGTYTIGRRAESDLAIPWDPQVSGVHAELRLLAGEFTIVDDGLSTNGTYLNGRRVEGRQRLRDGDTIRVGETMLAFRSGDAENAQRTAVAVDRRELLELTEAQRRVLVALCRPCRAADPLNTPATNRQIAAELFVSVDAVKMQLRGLFGKFGLADLPQNQKRTLLAERALQMGLVTKRDLE
jgi:pSer/pThr/pTyr-binding forkhead associated (FHA) protein